MTQNRWKISERKEGTNTKKTDKAQENMTNCGYSEFTE